MVQEKQQKRPVQEDEGKDEFEYELEQALTKSFSEGGQELRRYYDFCTDRHSSDVRRQVDEYEQLSEDLKGASGSTKEDSRTRKSIHMQLLKVARTVLTRIFQQSTYDEFMNPQKAVRTPGKKSTAKNRKTSTSKSVTPKKGPKFNNNEMMFLYKYFDENNADTAEQMKALLDQLKMPAEQCLVFEIVLVGDEQH